MSNSLLVLVQVRRAIAVATTLEPVVLHDAREVREE
jgi:hypothetical protein